MSHSQVAWSPEPGENRRGAQLDLGAADPRRRSGARLAKRYHSFPGPPPSPGDERGASTAPAEFNTSWGSKGPATRKRQEILATLGPSSSPGPPRVPWAWPGCASTVGAAPQAPSCGPRPGEAPGLETRRGRPHPARTMTTLFLQVMQRGSERLRHLLKVTQLISGRTRIPARLCLLLIAFSHTPMGPPS